MNIATMWDQAKARGGRDRGRVYRSGWFSFFPPDWIFTPRGQSHILPPMTSWREEGSQRPWRKHDHWVGAMGSVFIQM